MLSIVTQEVTMSSIDFLNDYINPAREVSGQKPLRNTELVRKLKDELDLTVADFMQATPSTGGTPQSYVSLTYDQMMLVGMRESKAVRKSVLAKLKELQKPKEDPIVLLAQKVLQQDAEIKHLEKTKAQINDKRTATLMNKASQDAKRIKKLESKLQDVGNYKSLIAASLPSRVDTEFKLNVQTWRILKQISEKLGHDIIKVKDERYGQVNTYHVDVIDEFMLEYM